MNFPTIFQRLLIPRYLLRALVGPLLFSFFCLMFIFLLHFVMRYIDQLVGKGLSAWVIIELISLNLAWMVVLAVPMAVLVATLMAFGDLSQSNEITAMKAAGMSLTRMLRPLLIASGILAFLLILFNNDILPEANHQAKVLTLDIRRKKPTLNIVAGYFSREVPGYSILVKKTFEESNDLEGITLYDYTKPNLNTVVTAERGTISFSGDFRKLILNLEEGEIHELDATNFQTYRRVRFVRHRISTAVEGFDFARSATEQSSRGDRELSASEMLSIIDSLTQVRATKEVGLRRMIDEDIRRVFAGTPDSVLPSRPFRSGQSSVSRSKAMYSRIQNELSQMSFLGKQINQYSVEVHKKYTIPLACVVFVLVGLPLGVMVRRGGFGMAATLSLGFFVLYWAFLIGGEKLADRDILSPVWGMWSANIIIGITGLMLLTRVSREAIVLRFDFFGKLIPRAWKQEIRKGM
jgi:lipopolysaccharide export system permease protein